MVTKTVIPEEPDAVRTPPSKSRPSQATQPLPEVLLVVLALQELVAQQPAPLVAGGIQGRVGQEHQPVRIPARPSSSTS